jgi:hypothetical protein
MHPPLYTTAEKKRRVNDLLQGPLPFIHPRYYRNQGHNTCLLRNRFCWLASLSFLVSFALSVSASNAFICHIQFETEDLSKINWLKSHTTKMLSLASFREKINKNKGYF